MRRLVLAGTVGFAVLAGLTIPAQAAAPVPSLTVTPSTDLVDGSVGTVAGDGWLPHEEVSLIQEAGPSLRPPPTVTVSPAAGLVDQQPVTVTGAHWGFADEIELLECVAAGDRCSAPMDLTWRDSDGYGFTHTFHVRSGFTAEDGGWVDCRTESCLLRAKEPGVGAPAADTPLAFDPAGPPATPPSVSASPDTDLVDGQVITVSGTGLRPNQSRLRVIVCAQAEPRHCTTGADVGTDAAGAFSVPFTVFATNFGYDTVDCRSEPCLVRLADELGIVDVSVPVAFRADGPLVYNPSVSLDTDVGLVDGQVLTVSGTGWEPGRRVTIRECSADRSRCPGYDVEVEADAAGSFTTEFRVRAHGDIRRRGEIDCRTDTCELSFDSFRSRVVVALAFDPDAPLLPPPTVEVTPNHDLLPGQQVRVDGTGFFPHQELVWGQCDRSDYLEPPYCYWGDLIADATGHVSFTTRVSVSLLRYHGASDCRPDRCYIGISTDLEWYPLAMTALHQRPEGDEHVAVHPTSGLLDGDAVTVDATGLNVGFDVHLAQCVFPDPDDPDSVLCAPGALTVPVSPDGEVHTAIHVRERFEAEDTAAPTGFDCRVDTCHVVVSGAGVDYEPWSMYPGEFQWQGAAISFADGAVPAQPTAVTPAFAG